MSPDVPSSRHKMFATAREKKEEIMVENKCKNQ